MAKSPRLLSLDVFRGLTIAGMVLVNSPGNETAYTQLDHSVWNGCTFTDLVFPFFVFIVGVSLVFSLSNRLAQGESKSNLLNKVLKRATIIFGLGLLLNGFPFFHLNTLRIPGVLQRIALCYLFSALIFLGTSSYPAMIRKSFLSGEYNLRGRSGWTMELLVVCVLLFGYWLAMTQIPVPGYGTGNLTKEGSLASFMDRYVLSGHMYRQVYDPEGLLSTFPAIATALLGNLTGLWLLSSRSDINKVWGMILAGTVACLLGWVWGLHFPINKALWTSSYVLWTGGLALYLLAVCYWLIEIMHWQRWSKPFEIFGLNAIAVYLLHIVFLKVQNLIHLPRLDGSPGNLRFYFTEHLFGWASLPNASLFYALSYTLLWLLVLSFLYRRKVFIKI